MINNWIVVTFHFIDFVALDLNNNQVMKVHSFQLKALCYQALEETSAGRLPALVRF